MAISENLEDKISFLIMKAIQDRVFSGCCVAIGRSKKNLIKNFGTVSWNERVPVTDDTFFDLASLTKPLATSLAVFTLIEKNKIKFEDKLGQLLEAEVPAEKKNINLFQLLNHCSGLAAHRPFYKFLEKISIKKRKEELLRFILAEPLEFTPGKRDIYSDLGFILLGLIVEKKTGMTLDDAVKRYVYEPLNLADKLLFNPKEKGINNFATTEECIWRGRMLKGEVDDQNTWVIGGVSGQAGLFGRGRDVLYVIKKLTEIASGAKKHPYLSKDLLVNAMGRQNKIKGSNWGLGFDTPSCIGSSSGQFISQRSCGHLGFTGTSFWHDFDQDITVVLLTNRIHPSAENNKIKTFRPLFHDLVFETHD